MEKSLASFNESELPKSTDLSHHLSDLAKARAVSPLKGFFRYYGRPGLLALAGGQFLRAPSVHPSDRYNS